MRQPLSVRAGVDHAPLVHELVADKVASRIAAKDPTLWGPGAEAEAAIRLGWVDLATSSRPLVAEIEELRDELWADGVDRVVLCGMGGSSLAPEVVSRTYDAPLTILDSTNPQVVASALAADLERTIVVVSSKSGSTAETDSQRRAFEAALTAAGIDAPSRLVVVTDPGSALETLARERGYRHTFLADPNVGGRYSALTAFGLVPTGLAGIDVADLLDEAEEVMPALSDDSPDNPALVLAAAMAGSPGRDKLAIADAGSGIVGFADWAEQLIAESTGKEGKGLLPVVVESVDAPEVRWAAADVSVAVLTGDDHAGAPEGAMTTSGTLGAQMLLWETATAVAGRVLGIDPFDQPDVESAKRAARGLLDEQPDQQPPAFTENGIEVRGTAGLLDGVETLAGSIDALLGMLPPQGYLAVMAYVDATRDADLAGVRTPLALRTERPVTFGWGPRFLHSTGQYHKGGPPDGVFLQITTAETSDVDVPDRPFTFGQLITAQAAGDAAVLADHGRPVLRLHLSDPAGMARLVDLLA